MSAMAANARPGCVFCAIVAGATGASVVARDAVTMTFLDARPIFPGHCLVVPVEHADDLADVPPATLAAMMEAGRRAAAAQAAALGAEGAFVAINHRVSQSVPHLHLHVVPRRKGDGLRGFFWPRRAYENAEEQERIRAALAAALV